LFVNKPQGVADTLWLGEDSEMDETTSEGGSCGTTTHALLTLPVVLSVLWALFCLFYHTRLFALLLSWLINRFLYGSHVTIGELLTALTSVLEIYRN